MTISEKKSGEVKVSKNLLGKKSKQKGDVIMGGPSGYDGDVGERTRSTQREEIFQPAPREIVRTLTISKLQNPKKLIRECLDTVHHPETTPIVVIIDITLSRIGDIAHIFAKLPMFIGQIVMRDYVKDPQISFAAVGDATDNDEFPIQIGEFESDNKLDDSLKAIILEKGGGGGSGQESYQLMTYFYANHSSLSCNERGKKGYFFFIGDEGFYPTISKNEVKRIFGENIENDINSAEAFAKLQQKYEVFFIYPKKEWEERKKGIDAEIQNRVENAGGQYKDVDIRASLIWHNRNDLDLHCETPSGEEIYFHNKQVGHGALDVDMNVHGETTKPVENIRWPEGKAPKGKYKFYVENYGFHESSKAGTPFKVEIEINGEFQTFELKTIANETSRDSRVKVIDFDYDPNQRKVIKDNYANYDDTLIKNQWRSVIPRDHVVSITNPKAVVDAMLGVLALLNGKTLPEYVIDMQGRDQTPERIEEINKSLSNLAISYGLEKVDVELPPTTGGEPSKTHRI